MNKLIVTIFVATFFFIPLLPQAQNSEKRGISTEEKRELEKKFAGLKTFYIADDGTVVFYQQNNGTVSDSSKQDTAETPPQPKVKVKVSVDETGDYVVTTEESNYEYIESQEIPTEADFIQPENASESKIVIETREEYIHTPIKTEEKEEIAAETDIISTEEPQTPVTETIVETVPEEKEEIIIETESTATKEEPLNNKVKKEVFKKRESSYKSLEEAALAVDELLEELKRQQAEYNNRGKSSLSRKVTGKVDGSLRKTPYEFSNANGENNSSPVTSVVLEDMGEEPTYYINGVQSTKEEVDKLKKSDILKKTVKRSRTNPNGEWWIETVKLPAVTE